MASDDPDSTEEEQLAALRLPPGESRPPPRPDAETSREGADLELQKKEAEIDRLRADVQRALAEVEEIRIHNAGLAQDIQAREKFAKILFGVSCVWLVLVVVITVAVGLHRLVLSDAVIIALIGTTTINVLAFFRCVTEYLFPSERKAIAKPKDATKTK